MNRVTKICGLMGLILYAARANADFQKGLVAYDAGKYEEAFSEWMESAEAGDLAAQRNVGQLYRWGRGVEKSPEKAFYWYKKAADKGFSEAEYSLALMYLSGEGTRKNEKEAVRLLRSAAKKGSYNAERKLIEIEDIVKSVGIETPAAEETRKVEPKASSAKNENGKAVRHEKAEVKTVIKTETEVEEKEKAGEKVIIKNEVVKVEEVKVPARAESKSASEAKEKPVKDHSVTVAASEKKAKTETVKHEPEKQGNAAAQKSEKSVTASAEKPAEVKKADADSKHVEDKNAGESEKKTVAKKNAADSEKFVSGNSTLNAHLASYRSAKRANQGWAELKKKFPALNNMKSSLRYVYLDKKGEYIRLYVTGKEADVKKLCEDMKTAGDYCRITY